MTVIDDFLPKKDFVALADYLLSDYFVWHYNKSSYLETPVERVGNCIDYPQLIHRVYYDGHAVSQQTYDAMDSLIKRISPKNLIRIKCNLNFNDSDMEDGCYGFPHIDTDAPDSKTAILYVNDSEGDTFFFNEPYGLDFQNYTVNKTVTPKANRLVVFPSSVMHAGSTPKNSKRRVVININYQ